MRKFVFTLILSLFSLISVKAQFISPVSSYIDGISIGIEKNKSFFIEYGNKGFNARMKHTIIVDRIKYQNFRVEGGYFFNTKSVDLTCDLFYSSDWNFSNYNIGSQISLISRIFDKYGNIGISYVPYYDKELKFNNGWTVSGKVNATKEISFVVEYGKVPDYYIAYNRLYIGAILKVNNLSVYPLIEIPIYESESHFSHSQMLVSVCYTLGKKKK